MRVNFPNTSVIDASAERLRKHLKKSVSRDQARNIVSQCYGYNNYVHLQRSRSEAPPQLDTLSQDQILSLRLYQLNTLTAVLHLRQNSAEEVWMAMSPNIELAGPQRLLLGQIGRYTFEWGQPDEYGEDTEVVKVSTFFIGVQCQRCGGTGEVEPVIEQDYDMENPPVYGESRCELCDGTGIYHEPDGTLNSLRLTREEQEIQLRCELYYDRLENSYEDEEFVRYSAEDEYTGWDGEHDEDNPEMDLGDDEDYELELEDGEDDGAFEDIDNEDGAYN